MSKWVDSSGKTTLGIGICARCGRKFSLDDLYSDPNSPGLKVCLDDMDEYDPYRLPPRQPDKIALPFYRPDEALDGSGASDWIDGTGGGGEGAEDGLDSGSSPGTTEEGTLSPRTGNTVVRGAVMSTLTSIPAEPADEVDVETPRTSQPTVATDSVRSNASAAGDDWTPPVVACTLIDAASVLAEYLANGSYQDLGSLGSFPTENFSNIPVSGCDPVILEMDFTLPNYAYIQVFTQGATGDLNGAFTCAIFRSNDVYPAVTGLTQIGIDLNVTVTEETATPNGDGVRRKYFIVYQPNESTQSGLVGGQMNWNAP